VEIIQILFEHDVTFKQTIEKNRKKNISCKVIAWWVFGGVRIARSTESKIYLDLCFLCSVLYIVVCTFLLAIVLPVLRITTSERNFFKCALPPNLNSWIRPWSCYHFAGYIFFFVVLEVTYAKLTLIPSSCSINALNTINQTIQNIGQCTRKPNHNRNQHLLLSGW
jgi:NADH:ubiquinone oxidoreductase subunit 3 (subunit A)